MGKIIQDFQKFIMRGNVVDMAVGIIIGSAFSTIVKSLVDDIIMPPIGMILGNVDFADLFLVLREGEEALPPYSTVSAAQEAGAVTLNYGIFVNNVVSFLIVGFAIFLMVRMVNNMYDLIEEEDPPVPPTTKACPYCHEIIKIEATRCPNCTSELQDEPDGQTA